MRRIYFKIGDDWLRRLANVADVERRDPRVQATVILEQGIAQLEREYGLADPQQPPRVIEGMWTPSYIETQNDADRVRQDTLASAVL
jgi:hypothetical protein